MRDYDAELDEIASEWNEFVDALNADDDAESRPRVFVGSAHPPVVEGMAGRPSEWTTVRRTCGMFLHPLGWAHLKERNRLEEYVKLHSTGWFSLVENVYSHKRGRSIFFNYDQLRALAPAWRCAGIFVYIGNPQFETATDSLVKMFNDFTAPAKRRGIPVYLFITPLSVKIPAVYEALSKPYKDNLPLWIYFCKQTGARGVAVDYPSSHYLTPAWGKYRDLAHGICKTCRQAGLEFVWCFDGESKSPGDVAKVATQLRRAGVVPDFWLVDHFQARQTRAVPETDETTVTGQARALVDGRY